MFERRLIHVSLALLIAGSIVVRTLGIVLPDPTSADEALLVEDVRQTLQHRGAGESILAVHEDLVRHVFLQRILAYPLIFVFGSPERATFGLSAIAGVISIAALSLAAARIFSAEAGAACALLMILSILHTNYSVKVLGVIHAQAAFSLGLLCFVSPMRSAWWLGGALLGLAFLLHYGAGLPIVALGVGIVVCDVGSGRSLRQAAGRLVRDRLAVAAAAAGVVLGYALLQRRFAGFDYLDRLVHHENLTYPAPQSRLYWLRILLALDPLVVAICAVSVMIVALRGRTRDLVAAFKPRLVDRFIDAPVIGVTAVVTALGLSAGKVLSGMARLLFLPAAIWYLAAAGVVAVASQTLSLRQRAAALVTVVALALLSLGLATHDWIATRETRAPVMAILNSHWDGVAVSANLNYADFLNSWTSFALLKRLSRTPDIVLGRPWYFDVPFYEEEPAKTLQLATLLSANDVVTLTPRDLVYTTLIYAVPPFTRQRCDRLRRMLPLMSNLVMSCNRPSFVRFPPDLW